MLAKLFRTTYPSHYLLFIIIAAIYQLPCFMALYRNVNLIPTTAYSNLWSLIANINPIILTITAFILLLCCMTLTIHTSNENSIPSKTSSVTAVIFSILFAFRMITPEFFASLFILIFLHKLMLLANNISYPELEFFSTSVMIGIASSFTPNALIFLIVLFLSTFVLKLFRIRYILLMIFGFFLPLSFFIGIVAINHDFTTIIQALTPDINVSFNIDAFNLQHLPYYIFYIILTIYIVLASLSKHHTILLTTRYKISILSLSTIFCLVAAVFSNNSASFLMLSVPSLTFLSSFFLSNSKNFSAFFWSIILILSPLLLLIVPK